MDDTRQAFAWILDCCSLYVSPALEVDFYNSQPLELCRVLEVIIHFPVFSKSIQKKRWTGIT